MSYSPFVNPTCAHGIGFVNPCAACGRGYPSPVTNIAVDLSPVLAALGRIEELLAHPLITTATSGASHAWRTLQDGTYVHAESYRRGVRDERTKQVDIVGQGGSRPGLAQ